MRHPSTIYLYDVLTSISTSEHAQLKYLTFSLAANVFLESHLAVVLHGKRCPHGRRWGVENARPRFHHCRQTT